MRYRSTNNHHCRWNSITHTGAMLGNQVLFCLNLLTFFRNFSLGKDKLKGHQKNPTITVTKNKQIQTSSGCNRVESFTLSSACVNIKTWILKLNALANVTVKRFFVQLYERPRVIVDGGWEVQNKSFETHLHIGKYFLCFIKQNYRSITILKWPKNFLQDVENTCSSTKIN